MDKNKFKYCTLLLINDYNHSKLFISEKNRYYIRGDNESILVKILNEVEEIRKFYKINVKDITDNYYKIDDPCIIKLCTILLRDDDNHSKIFISKKNLYYVSCVGDKYYDYDDNYNYDDYYDDCDDDNDYDDNDDYHDDFIVDYYDELVYYNKPLNDLKPVVSVEFNSFVNLINNDNYRHNIILLVDDFNIFIL